MLLHQKCCTLRVVYCVPFFFTVSVHICKVNQLLQKEINLLPAFMFGSYLGEEEGVSKVMRNINRIKMQ